MRLTIDKPVPIVQRLEFSQEDQDYINSMLEGNPSPRVVRYWQRSGHNMERHNKRYMPPQLKERRRVLSHKYQISMCCRCHEFPSVKLIYKLDGVNLVEYYCQDHLPG